MVLELRTGSETHRQLAFEELCRIYWRPLYTYARRGGFSSHDAEDLTQGFLTQILRRGNLGPLAPDKGRLRTFLKSAFQNFITDERRRVQRQKRGGNGTEWLDIEAAERQCQRFFADPSVQLGPEEEFDRHWARIVLQRSIHALRERFRERGRSETLKALEVYLGSDDLAPPYAEVGERLGQTENTIAAAVARMRREFRELLRQEIADTVGPTEDIDDELRYLLRVSA